MQQETAGEPSAGEPDWVPPGVDTRRANTARVYDYWLGGSHNFLADQDVARAIAAVQPNARAGALAGRQFIRRAVQFLAASGVRTPTCATRRRFSPAPAPGA